MSKLHNQNVRQAIRKSQRQRQAGSVVQAPIARIEEPDRAALQRALAVPSTATPAGILALQKTAGNRAVTWLIQTKLMVGPAGDRYEQEADRLEDQVLTMQLPSSDRRSAASEIQRQAEEEEEIRTKALVQRREEGGLEAGPKLESCLVARQGGGSPLPDETRAFMKSRFGADFSHVRIHTGDEAARLSRALSAQAFTHGQDVYMGADRYDPGSDTGKRLLAHELTHIVQQNSHAVQRYPEKLALRTRARLTFQNRGGVGIIQRRNDLTVRATYEGAQAVGQNGHEDETRGTIADKQPRLYNSLENVREPLNRSKFACAEANALANLLNITVMPTARYRDIHFGPARFTGETTLGQGVDTRFFPAGSNYRRCPNCQEWLEPPDFDRIRNL